MVCHICKVSNEAVHINYTLAMEDYGITINANLTTHKFLLWIKNKQAKPSA